MNAAGRRGFAVFSFIATGLFASHPRRGARSNRAGTERQFVVATRVENSPILAQNNRHILQSNFAPKSLKTDNGALHKVSHFSRLRIRTNRVPQ
jgi:hypothetical protein